MGQARKARVSLVYVFVQHLESIYKDLVSIYKDLVSIYTDLVSKLDVVSNCHTYKVSIFIYFWFQKDI